MIEYLKKKIKKLIGYNTSYQSVFISKELIFSYLPVNPIIIDCGAHIGIDTIQLSKSSGSKIYAFEPVNEIYQQLVENTKNYPNITCFKIALSATDGEADMYISSGDSDGSSSLLKPKEHIRDHPEVYFDNVTKVKCSTIDSWASENNVANVDMLWLDMQGAEQRMLMASTKILDKVKVIHTEVSLHETYEGVESYKVFKKFLKKKGFRIVAEAIPKGTCGGNVLFSRRETVI